MCIILNNCIAQENKINSRNKANNSENNNLIECECCTSDTSIHYDKRVITHYKYNAPLVNISQKTRLNNFTTIVEEAYINYIYIQFMEQIIFFRYRYDEKNNNNPKYYFYHALELLKKGKSAEADNYLKRFLSFDIKSSYRRQCDKYDVSWMNHHKDKDSYKIAELIHDNISKNNLETLDWQTINMLLDKYKSNDLEIELVENISFMLSRLLDSSYKGFKDIFVNDEKIIITSSLDRFNDPKNWYFLSSQLDILVYKKFIIAQKLLDDLDWDNSNLNKYGPAFIGYPDKIRSFILFYDLKRKLFGEHDRNLLSQIQSLVNNYPNIYPMKQQIISLINFYKSILETDIQDHQSELYLGLRASINKKRFKEFSSYLETLNNLYHNKNTNNLSSLDSAMIFLYQVELINSEILDMIPRHVSNSNSIFDMLDTNTVDSIKHLMLVRSDSLSFLANYAPNRFAPRKEFYYQHRTEPWKNIGYAFYSLNDITETRSLDYYFDPSEHNRNRGTDPLYNSFRIYKNLIENPLQNMNTTK